MKMGCLMVLGLLAFELHAARVELRSPHFSGNGCSRDSADITISADARRIDLSFNEFSIEAENGLQSGPVKKTCDAVFAIKVPHGFSVAVQRVRYHGNYNLPHGSNAHLSGAHFFNDEQLATVSERFFGRTRSPLEVVVGIPYHALAWTPCGEEVQLSSHTALIVSAKKSAYKATFRVDYLPARRGISYDLIYRSCETSIFRDD